MPNLNTLIKASEIVSPPQSPRKLIPRQFTPATEPLQAQREIHQHEIHIAHALLSLDPPQSKKQLSFKN